MQRNISSLIIRFSLGLLFTLPTILSVYALDVTYDGYFRTRGNYHYNLDLDRSRKPNIRAYSDMRFRLNPTFHITDKIRIRSSLNFLDGTLGGNPFRVQSYKNPAQTHDRTIDTADTEGLDTVGGVGGSLSTSTTSSMGGVYVPDGNIDSASWSALQIRRAWAEIDTPFGTLQAGRMPNQWGMGVFANAGDAFDQEVGSSRDRIMFETSLSNYYFRPGVGFLVEGALDSSNDDYYEYFFQFGRKADNQNIGISINYDCQDGYRKPSGATALDKAHTSFWAFDFYFQNQFRLLNIQSETALYSGKMNSKSLLAINSALRLDWTIPKWFLLNEVGFASGTSRSDLTNNEVKSVAFSRDYDVALILFEEALPGGKSLRNSSGTEDNIATAPHSGAISNAMYGRFKVGYDASDFFIPYLNLVAAYAPKKSFDMGGSFYGLEYDILTVWPINRYLQANFDFGHFIPASVYDNPTKVSKSHSTILLRAGIVAKF